ncbi:CU044_5270 family protein [Streptomyces sp. NPDC058953]|uniref:CU044_5270 family protein n=1 Tax=unclassified Streptomyces TaxID=2593676 RepID=UPI0036CEC6EC
MTTPRHRPDAPTPPPPEWDLPPGRHEALRAHLLTEIHRSAAGTADDAAAETDTDTTSVRFRRRWTRPALTAAVAVVAAVVTLTVLPADGASPRAASPEAAALLEGAALATKSQRLPDGIRDDQFVYIRSKVGWMAYTDGGGSGEASVVVDPVRKREVWLSIDGTRPGLLREPGGPGTLVLDPSTPHPNNTDYRNLQTLPTDPDEMFRWLRKNADGDKPVDQQTFTLVGDLIGESLLPPDVAAALFRAAAKIPGVELVEDSVDAAGRKGVAVAREDDGIREELIFDLATKTYLGEREVAVKDLGPGLEEGTVVGRSAILERTVVDAVDQRKPGLGPKKADTKKADTKKTTPKTADTKSAPVPRS